MKNIVVLGGGTAGTVLVNKLVKERELTDWHITVVDRDNRHYYQPGFLFVPFGMVPQKRIVKSRSKQLPKQVDFVQDEVVSIDQDIKVVRLASGRELPWDQLVIATGTVPRPDKIPGMADGKLWYQKVFDFYTYEGATALKPALEQLKKGRLVVHVTEMPIKCPVAPLEFALLAQDYFRKRGLDPAVDVVYVTPLDGAFTKPVAAKRLGHLLSERGIEVVPDFALESIDNETQELVSYDGRRVHFDLCVTVPPNLGSQVIAESGLTDDAGFVEVDKGTLQSTRNPDIWAGGDASTAPTSKAGSVAHFMMDALVPNLIAHIQGRPLPERFDGHANCFVESGRGEALLLDFNYEQEPVPGHLSIFGIPALKLLDTSRINHLSKLGFEPIYWTMLLPGLPMPIPAEMSMKGKKVPAEVEVRK